MADENETPEEQETNQAAGDDDAPPDNEDVAADWEAMLDSSEDDLASDPGWGEEVVADDGDDEGFGGLMGSGGGEASTRVLNQDEIDNLLGFDDNNDGGDKSGIQAILNSTLISYERLPMLEVVFDRLVRLLTTSLRNFTSDNVEVTLDNITSIRFGDYLNSIPLPAMLAVFNAHEWDNYGLMTVDSSLIYSVVDVLLGGRRGTAPMRIEGRPYTTIERNLVERMLNVVLADMSTAFEPLSPVNFVFDRLETNPRFATIARPANAAILIRCRIDMEDRGGKIETLLPYATLEPVRDLLLQMFMGEKFGRDAIWESHLAEQMFDTDVEIEAVLDEQVMNLGAVAELQIGDTLMLSANPGSPVELRCGNLPMLRGFMGRISDHVAVRVDSDISDRVGPS
jgi:flagellar motor switch protein FliM